MGWGKTSFDASSETSDKKPGQRILKQAELPIVDNDKCEELLVGTDRLGKRFMLDKSFLCAGGGKADACDGDGGGPLICPDMSNGNR